MPQKGRATTDHLLIIKEAIHLAKPKGKPLYMAIPEAQSSPGTTQQPGTVAPNSNRQNMALLDVTKAYDKAWLDAIMYVMEKEGLKSYHWSLVRKLNQNLTTKIRTKHGLTRKFHIKDSICQGRVLSIAQYVLFMDCLSHAKPASE